MPWFDDTVQRRSLRAPGLESLPNLTWFRHQMIDYWQAFAASGDPNVGVASARPAWPKYGGANATMLLNQVPSPASNIESNRCNFWHANHPVPYHH